MSTPNYFLNGERYIDLRTVCLHLGRPESYHTYRRKLAKHPKKIHGGCGTKHKHWLYPESVIQEIREGKW